jgi:glucans biosynthesis protein
MSRSAYSAERLTVDYAYVQDKARTLAEAPYDDNWGRTPDFLRDLNYDQYRSIQFDPQNALWSDAGLPFQILFTRAVTIHEFTDTHQQEVKFATEFFDYGENEEISNRIPASLGYAGFKVFSVLNKENLMDEFVVFLGSNYFRALARGQEYGLSARGIAIDTTLPEKEEFPSFRSFWLGKPTSEDAALVVYALLDGPSLTGAYRFDLHPGGVTDVTVSATLNFRRQVDQLGIAPLTSMFYFGENSLRKPMDYRNEVHDSDGFLIMEASDDVTWRPLVNPSENRVNRFQFESPVSFGLLQRDRNFNNYQDANAAYHLRPSAWVEPGQTGWGAGSLVLYEFPTQTEAIDNVVMMWEPEVSPATGESISYDYTIHFVSGEIDEGGRVVGTRIGIPIGQSHSGSPANEKGVGHLYDCVVDFAGPELSKLSEVEELKPVIETGKGIRLDESFLEKIPYTQNWRLILKIELTEPAKDREISAYLQLNGNRLTEKWSYSWVN